MQLSKLPSYLYLKKNANFNGKLSSEEPTMNYQATSRPSSGVTYPKLNNTKKMGTSRIFIDASAGTRISSNIPVIGKKLNRFSPHKLNKQQHYFNWEDEKIKRL